MGQYKDILVNINIEKSDEALEVAQESLENNRLTTALNRIYYAIFYTVIALAYKHNFETSKHAKLMGWFNKKFIYTDKIFDPKIYKIYENAFMLRQESDYETLYQPDIEQAKSLLADTKTFIKTVRKAI
ncbi:MAG: HEPN domain-containing protein [Heliobacteriaceae bacterium]|jgi:uncharacterized protein (UPF0332 family)|nr:HEPN domain-containing protein [Heliobacteriaceae bacterium]